MSVVSECCVVCECCVLCECICVLHIVSCLPLVLTLMDGELQRGSSLSLEGVEERDGGEYVCQVSTIGQLIATSFHLDIQGNTVSCWIYKVTQLASGYTRNSPLLKISK